MTEKLYRDEALKHQYRGLFGEVILSAPPASWVITVILIILFIVLGCIMMFGQVETDAGTVSILQWLLSRGQNG